MSAPAISPADYEALARQRLDDQAWAYLAGGAGDELTVQANVGAWQALRLQPRVLRPTAGGHTGLRLLGRDWAHPILLAPVAHQRLAHPDGELATALAASAQQAGMVLSLQSNTAVEVVAQVVHAEPQAGPLWMQLYPQPDRGFWRELVQRAQAAGCEALVLTVDAPVSGVRDRERRAQFRLPPGVSAVHLAGRPPAVAPPVGPGRSALFDGLLHAAPTWDDVDWLCAATELPVLLKGVMHPADAREALRHGVAGLIVSNHGGRTLDTAAPTALVLPQIVQAVEDRVPVLVDGGIRRGTDVFKALALGARAVLIGRPQVWALAAAGAHGVAHLLRLLRDELEIAMALCGCATLQDITAECLFDPSRP